MTNYIEVIHEYVDEVGDTNFDVHYAVKPTPSCFTSSSGAQPFQLESRWRIEAFEVYTLEDIAGMRKLLDAIEAEMGK